TASEMLVKRLAASRFLMRYPAESARIFHAMRGTERRSGAEGSEVLTRKLGGPGLTRLHDSSGGVKEGGDRDHAREAEEHGDGDADQGGEDGSEAVDGEAEGEGAFAAARCDAEAGGEGDAHDEAERRHGDGDDEEAHGEGGWKQRRECVGEDEV